MNVDWNDDSLIKPSQEEREVIISIYNRQRFEYEEEATLCVCDENEAGKEEEEEPSESESGSDYEVEDNLKKEHHELSNFSFDFMRRLVDYAFEENKLE